MEEEDERSYWDQRQDQTKEDQTVFLKLRLCCAIDQDRAIHIKQRSSYGQTTQKCIILKSNGNFNPGDLPVIYACSTTLRNGGLPVNYAVFKNISTSGKI